MVRMRVSSTSGSAAAPAWRAAEAVPAGANSCFAAWKAGERVARCAEGSRACAGLDSLSESVRLARCDVGHLARVHIYERLWREYLPRREGGGRVHGQAAGRAGGRVPLRGRES